MDVIDRVKQLIVENGLDQEKASKIESVIRFEYGGELVYFPKKSETIKESIFKDLKNGASENDIIRKFRVSKITAYRMMRKVKRGLT